MAAWNVLKNGGSALDAVTAGTSRCEGQGYPDGSKIESGTVKILSQNRRFGYLWSKRYSVTVQLAGETILTKMAKLLLMP